MGLKNWSLIFVLVLLLLFSVVAHSETLQEGTTIDGIYYGKGYNPENPILFIGGILQNGPNPDDNPELKKIADDNHAIYDPAYCSGGSVSNIKKDALAVNEAALGKQTDYNGLKSPTLENGKHYDKIIAYSGGTATALTALAQQGVTCNTLILISPMAAGVPDAETKIDTLVSAKKKATISLMRTGIVNLEQQQRSQEEVNKIKEEARQIAQKNFEDQIVQVLSGDSSAVKNIIVIQSDDDDLPLGDIFQYKFPKQKIDSPISVHNIDLDGVGEVVGIQGHQDMLEHANEYFTNPPVLVGVAQIGTVAPQSEVNWQETSLTDTSKSDAKETLQTKPESNTEESARIPVLHPVTSPPPDESNAEDSTVIPTLYPITSLPPDESNTEESARIPVLHPITSPPPDESNAEDSTVIPTLYPITSLPPDESNTEESARIPVLHPITGPPPDESIIKESSTTSRLTESKFGDTTLSVAQPVDSKPDIAFGDTKESSTTAQITKSKFGEIPFGGNQRQVTSHSKISFGDQADVPASQERSDVVLIDSDYGAKFFSERSDRSAEKHENGLKEAVALSLQGKYDDAVQVYKTAIGFEAEDTTYARFYFEIGDTLIQQGRNDEAIQMYKKVLTLDPDSYAIGIYDPSSAWARIGDALNGLGRTTEAKAAFVVADELKQEYENLQNYSNPQKSGQGDWLQFGSGRSSWEEEDKMIRSTGGYSRPAPGQGSPGSSGGLTPEQRQAIEQAIDNMEPVGEYNQYYNTNPRYELAGDPSWAN